MEQTNTRRRDRRQRITMTPVMWGLLAAFLVTAIITTYLTFVTVREIARTAPIAEECTTGRNRRRSACPKINLLDLWMIPLQGEDGPAACSPGMGLTG